ncbi:MAG: winged helix-turn-helix domain-containing protein [Myxococcota bacterium]
MPDQPPRLRIRFEFEGRHTLGPGKVQLLEAVGELGSISAAARATGMSYRHAWELLDDVNRCFAGRVLETEAGGRSGGGAQLTDFGRELIRRYRAMQAKAGDALAADLASLDALRSSPETDGASS